MVDSGLRLLERTLSVLSGVILAGMTIIVFVAVILRYIFNAPLLYSYDLSTLLFAWVVFLGLALAEWDRAHLGLDLVERIRNRPVRLALGTLRQLAMAGLSLWLAWVGLRLTQRTGMQIPSMRLSVAWLYGVMPAGFACLALLQLVRIRALVDPATDHPAEPGEGI